MPPTTGSTLTTFPARPETWRPASIYAIFSSSSVAGVRLASLLLKQGGSDGLVLAWYPAATFDADSTIATTFSPTGAEWSRVQDTLTLQAIPIPPELLVTPGTELCLQISNADPDDTTTAIALTIEDEPLLR